MCPCKTGEQTKDHILYDCELVKHDRDKLKTEILLRSENWLVKKDTLINKYKCLAPTHAIQPVNN